MFYPWHIPAGFSSEAIKIIGSAVAGYIVGLYSERAKFKAVRNRQRKKLYERLADLFLVVQFCQDRLRSCDTANLGARARIEFDTARRLLQAMRLPLFLDPKDYQNLNAEELIAALDIQARHPPPDCDNDTLFAEKLSSVVDGFGRAFAAGQLSKIFFDRCCRRRREKVLDLTLAVGVEMLREVPKFRQEQDDILATRSAVKKDSGREN